jgi:hypothetical protein
MQRDIIYSSLLRRRAANDSSLTPVFENKFHSLNLFLRKRRYEALAELLQQRSWERNSPGMHVHVVTGKMTELRDTRSKGTARTFI